MESSAKRGFKRKEQINHAGGEQAYGDNRDIDLLISGVKNEEMKVSQFYFQNLKETPVGLNSDEIGSYYTCITGWNPIWYQFKPMFERKVSEVSESSQNSLDRSQRFVASEYLIDLHKCFSLKLMQLTEKLIPDILEEDRVLVELRTKLYQKQFTDKRYTKTK